MTASRFYKLIYLSLGYKLIFLFVVVVVVMVMVVVVVVVVQSNIRL